MATLTQTPAPVEIPQAETPTQQEYKAPEYVFPQKDYSNIDHLVNALTSLSREKPVSVPETDIQTKLLKFEKILKLLKSRL